MFCMICVILVLVVLCSIYHEISKRKQIRYFKDRGVHPQEPQFILFRLREFATNNVADLLQKLYNSFENQKVVGFFNSSVPNYFVRDPALVKQIAVKDFDHFMDHLKVVDVNHDRFFGKTLIALDGNEWREMRSTLSPAFTGSKMRLMFQLVLQCSQNMTTYFWDQCKMNGPQSYDMKDIYCKYTNDVIASCAFGIKCDSFREPENDFYKTGKRIANFLTPWNMFKFMIYRILPWKIVATLLDIRLIDREGQKVFSEIIMTTLKMREEKNIYRPDMINLLMEMKKGQLKANSEVETHDIITPVDDHVHRTTDSKLILTDDLLIPQCFIFFLAGFDTSSTLMTFVAYELAVNKDVQDRLIEEVDRTVDELAGKPIDYNILQSMAYLDMVIAETLRKWPPVPLIDRLCVKDYKYEGDDGFQMTIDKGADVMVPTYALHRDAKYYPEPEKFDPDRFSPENKASINLDAYIPFGIGPRNCIGSRFALMETKSVIYHLLLNFTFEVCEKTQVPIKLQKTMGGVIPEKFELVLKPRREL